MNGGRAANNAIVWGLDFATGAAYAFPSHVDVSLTPAGIDGAAAPPQARPGGRRLSPGLVAAQTRSAAARFQNRLGARSNGRRTASGRTP